MVCSQNWDMTKIQWFAVFSHVFSIENVQSHSESPHFGSLVTAQHLKLTGVLAAFGVAPPTIRGSKVVQDFNG